MFALARGIGVTERLHGQAGTVGVALFALLTQLGDVWFLFVLGGGVYVAGSTVPRLAVDRRQGLFVFALVVTYVVLVSTLKPLFGLPRPPGAGEAPAVGWLPPILAGVFENITTASSSGFPSGHALGATMVWGGVALVIDGVRDRVRFGLAAVVVAIVATSRLVLGVHYLVDVIAGVGLGLAVLGACYWLADGGTDPGRVLGVAVAVGVLAMFVDGSAISGAAAGAAVGSWLVCRRVADTVPIRATSRGEVIAGIVVLAIVGGLSGVLYALDPPVTVAFVGGAVTGGGAVAAPMIGTRAT
ncbi:phosphatase PAP2 family protein [Halorientalis pallida]|uniref:Phosphatase PAP2 family protein n=1 Tax=Halorientalis pallida TaxID=2479928 RepID=A0A498KWD6_9EURY|nr:phosphatase PAP2 family protein [Halorientalis pallida]